MKRDIHDYDKILYLTHHQSAIRPHMPRYNRAVQFAPFAALTGYDDNIKEAARLTDAKREIGELRAALLNERMRMLQEHSAECPPVTITYFQPDRKKSGGAYVTAAGNVRWIDLYAGYVIFTDGTKIPIPEIFDIQGDLFSIEGP